MGVSFDYTILFYLELLSNLLQKYFPTNGSIGKLINSVKFRKTCIFCGIIKKINNLQKFIMINLGEKGVIYERIFKKNR